jgi:hypothetical protein
MLLVYNIKPAVCVRSEITHRAYETNFAKKRYESKIGGHSFILKAFYFCSLVRIKAGCMVSREKRVNAVVYLIVTFSI